MPHYCVVARHTTDSPSNILLNVKSSSGHHFFIQEYKLEMELVIDTYLGKRIDCQNLLLSQKSSIVLAGILVKSPFDPKLSCHC
jgi:hypothetical protein